MLLQQTCSQGLFNVCVAKRPTCEGFVSLVFLLQIIFKHFTVTVVVSLIQALRVEMFEQGASMTKTLYYRQCHMTSVVSVLALLESLWEKSSLLWSSIPPRALWRKSALFLFFFSLFKMPFFSPNYTKTTAIDSQ